MADGEEAARREAVRRVMAGEPVAAVATALGRSQPWVRKWVARYDPSDDAWATARSSAPPVTANRTPAETEALVLKVRRQLAGDAWAQVGPAAIAWELDRLGEPDPPTLRTIARIIARAGEPRRGRRPRYQPRGTPYPAPPAQAPNACQQADLVGPRHLEGGAAFYAVNAVDVGRRKVAGEITTSKSAASVCAALTAIWNRLGVPCRLQLDNQQGLAGSGNEPGAVARLCVAHGVTPVYIPFAEPWRNGVVEHFNDTFDKQFFRAERFPTPERVAARYAEFTAFHNARHCYSALGGLTPDQAEARADVTPTRPDPDQAVPPRLAELTGRVEFIRLIRSDATLRVMSHNFPMPDELVYDYVVASLDTAAQQLTVYHHGVEVTTFPYPLK